MTNTLDYMKSGHLPDVAWLVILLGIFKADDEIFTPNYKYVKGRETVELQLANDDGFWTNLMP